MYKNSNMIRTIVTPSNTDLHVLIPKEYVGKQIEILLFSVDETKESGIKEIVKESSSIDTVGTSDEAWLTLSDETLSDIWDTPENEIWDDYYLKLNEKTNV